MDSDRVLVLGQGRVVEFGHPFELLAVDQEDVVITKREGEFGKMARATGDHNAQQLF